MPGRLRVLIVEDSVDDADLIMRELRRGGFDVDAARVQTSQAMKDALREANWDVVLSDHTMPGFSSGRALEILRQTGLDVPFLIVSGSIGEEHAVAAMRAGCHDYIMKDNLVRLAPAVQRELREAEVRRAHLAAEEELHRSEERLRLLFEESLDAIIVADEGGRFVQVNEAACRLFGQTREALLQMGVTDLSTPEGAPDAAAILAKYRLRGQDTGEFTFGRADGEWRVAEYSARRFSRDLHVRILRDVTERRQAEQALRQSEQRFTMFMQNLPGVAFMKDLQCRYVFMNQLMQRTFSLRRTDWLGRTDEEIWSEATAGFAQSDRVVIESRKFVEVVETISQPDGQHAWLVSKFPLFDFKGDVVMIGGIGIDITERRRAEEQREKLQAQLQQAQKLESLGTLAGGIAHDFNNLLTIIISNAQFVRESLTVPPTHETALQDIETAAMHAADMTRALQTFSRPHTPQVRVVDANRMMDEVHRLLRRLIPAIIEFRVNVYPEPCVVSVDAGQIQQALVNLCVNARDAMPGGGTLELGTALCSSAELPVSIRSKLVGERWVQITVRDTGSGMDAETLERAFDPFFSTKPKDRGTGLGLAIVYGIVEAHHGGIDVQSHPGAGSTFRLYFPQAAASAQGQLPTPVVMGRGEGHILVVDDEEMIASLLKTLLESRGYTVEIAHRAEQAIEIVRTGREVDLVIIDYSMPQMTGDLCLTELQQIKPHLPAIMITGYEMENAVLPAGTRVLPKPFTTHALVEAVRELLNNNNKSQPA